MPTLIKITGIKEQPITVVEKFASRFKPVPSGCWEWQGHTNSGYGRFGINGRTRPTHRIMWELIGREVDLSLQLDHICNNRKCLNPQHLRQVTAAENSLRSTSPAARNALKAYCKYGHEFSPDNTEIYYWQMPSGLIRKTRNCLICKEKRIAAQVARRQARLDQAKKPKPAPKPPTKRAWNSGTADMVTLECPYCEVVFERRRWLKAKYCSRHCGMSHRNDPERIKVTRRKV